jgi:hypothetical protein
MIAPDFPLVSDKVLQLTVFLVRLRLKRLAPSPVDVSRPLVRQEQREMRFRADVRR